MSGTVPLRFAEHSPEAMAERAEAFFGEMDARRSVRDFSDRAVPRTLIEAAIRTVEHCYVQESCGIAAGPFVAALHHTGLATLTHTPSPMRVLSEVLERPSDEAPLVLFPVGYPAEGAQVPDVARKPLDAVAVWRTGRGAEGAP